MGDFDEFRKQISCIRKDAGAYNIDGIWVEGAETPFEIIGDIQTLSQFELDQLPEGRRLNKSFRIYSEIRLNDLNNKNPDIILINGERFEVLSSYPHQEHNVIDHFKTIIQKVEQGL